MDTLLWIGPPIDDDEIVQRLPSALADKLHTQNGYITALGGFHLRGASLLPDWHSVRAAWKGPQALHQLFPAVVPSDVPFAEDCFGDQFLIRGEDVIRLEGETGAIVNMNMGVLDFIKRAEANPFDFLNLQVLRRYWEQGGTLKPGQLLSVYPPFVVVGGGASFRPIPALERISALADFARQISGLEDGQQVGIVPKLSE